MKVVIRIPTTQPNVRYWLLCASMRAIFATSMMFDGDGSQFNGLTERFSISKALQTERVLGKSQENQRARSDSPKTHT